MEDGGKGGDVDATRRDTANPDMGCYVIVVIIYIIGIVCVENIRI